MKRSNFVIISTILGSLLATNPFVFQAKAFAAQELEFVNLGCTQNLRTVLKQQAPDYCRSAEADSGVLFDQYKVTRNSDRSIKLEFRVFNRGSADALVEVYDSSGRLRDIKIIDGNRPPTGLIQSGGDLFTKVPASIFSRYPLGDARRDLKEQNIIVTIPAGGSGKITKSSNFAIWYNTAMLAVEIAQLTQGDSEFTKSETTKRLVREFAKEFGTQTAINIFTGEPSLQSVFSLDFIDKNRLGEVLQKLVQYTATIESDPSKNPILGAFSDVYLTGANYGIEAAIDKYILPGLGTLARRVRIGGNTVNTFARAADLRNSMVYGQKATVILRDVSRSATAASFDHKRFARSTVNRFADQVPDFASRTEYFYTEIDLNKDGNKEVILVVFSPACGVRECNGYILQKNGLQYRVIGVIGVQSSGGEIVAIQRSMSNGFIDIANQLYNPATRTSVWGISRFDGNSYRSTYQFLNTRPSRVILNVKIGTGLKL
jgi:hypothetical protein